VKPKPKPAPVVAQHHSMPPSDAPPPPAVYSTAPQVCHTCATIESVRGVTQEGSGSGVGAVAGGVLGSTLGATPGRASFVGSTALWGGVAFGLTTGAVSPDDTERDDRTALASAIGVAAGTLGGAIVAGPLSPSPARVRLTDLAALGGGVLMAGGYLALTDGEFEQRTTLGMGTVGIAAGYAVGWYMTRHMPADRPADRAATKTSFFPQVVPTRGGATLGVAGSF